MPSPFPGMDPYLEVPDLWHTFHTRFIADLQVALARVGIIGQQDVADPFADVFLVFFPGGVGLGRQRGEHVVEQLAGPLVETQAHHARCGRGAVDVEHVFQIGQVLARDGADAPHFF